MEIVSELGYKLACELYEKYKNSFVNTKQHRYKMMIVKAIVDYEKKFNLDSIVKD